MNKHTRLLTTLCLASFGSGAAFAKAPKPVKVTLDAITAEGIGKPVGTLVLKETPKGLEITAALKGLAPGEHGFHLHEKPSCEPGEKDGKKAAGIGAGPHFDPDGTKAHKGPGGGGHKGDLPKLTADDKGTVKAKETVAGLTLADVQGKAFMVHAGGDNYADDPKPLGGGGDRIACGVVPGGAEAKPAGEAKK